jgi:hypothetical protein
VTILDACADPNLFAAWFRDRATWESWFSFLAALFGLPMTPEQLATYQRCTGRTAPPSAPSSEAWLVIGRRGGKSFMLALIAVFLACFTDYRKYLQPGERGTILVLATDRKQARAILRYVRGLLSNIPMLARMIERETADAFDLNNFVTIEITTASFRTTRGYTIVAALCDELAFWPTSEESAEPDVEILAALRPGMATIPNAMLLCASSPYARRGALWDAHRRWFGKADAPALVWQADTRTMNPAVPQRVIDEAMERDTASAAAEYGAQFRSDIAAFVTREAVAACVEPGIFERARLREHAYVGFVDPSGGSADSMTLAIGHMERDTAVLDCTREVKPPFSPESVVVEFADTLKAYGITRITGDRYAGEWPREQFSKYGITYEPHAKPKSDLYKDFLPLVNSRRALLLDNPKLATQLCSLERRTARGGRDSIDHAPGAHDDVANCVAGVIVALAGDAGSAYTHAILNSISGPEGSAGHSVSRLFMSGLIR